MVVPGQFFGFFCLLLLLSSGSCAKIGVERVQMTVEAGLEAASALALSAEHAASKAMIEATAGLTSQAELQAAISTAMEARASLESKMALESARGHHHHHSSSHHESNKTVVAVIREDKQDDSSKSNHGHGHHHRSNETKNDDDDSHKHGKNKHGKNKHGKNKKSASPNRSDSKYDGKINSVDEGEYGMRLLAYYTSWSIYVREYMPADIPADKLTHLNYAFANIVDGKCALGDSYADVEKAFEGDTWEVPIKGNFHQLNNITKTKYPHLKTIISVGGWRWSKDWSDVALTKESRQVFVDSCIDFMLMYGFDGVDLDWEYPVEGGMPNNTYRPEDGWNYLQLVKLFRHEMDKKGDGYLLTIAAPADEKKYKHLKLDQMAKSIDWFNIMTYDYNACWGLGYGAVTSSHHTQLYCNPKDPLESSKTFNCDYTMQGFLHANVPARQIGIGAAFYGKGYVGFTDEGNNAKTPFLFQEYTACPKGTWDNWDTGDTGTYDYSDIKARLAGGGNSGGSSWTRYYDDKAQAVFAIGRGIGENIMVSYDDSQSLNAKIDYCKDNKIGGIFIWSLDGDIDGELVHSMYSHAKGKFKAQQSYNTKRLTHYENVNLFNKDGGAVDGTADAGSEDASIAAQKKIIEQQVAQQAAQLKQMQSQMGTVTVPGLPAGVDPTDVEAVAQAKQEAIIAEQIRRQNDQLAAMQNIQSGVTIPGATSFTDPSMPTLVNGASGLGSDDESDDADVVPSPKPSPEPQPIVIDYKMPEGQFGPMAVAASIATKALPAVAEPSKTASTHHKSSTHHASHHTSTLSSKKTKKTSVKEKVEPSPSPAPVVEAKKSSSHHTHHHSSKTTHRHSGVILTSHGSEMTTIHLPTNSSHDYEPPRVQRVNTLDDLIAAERLLQKNATFSIPTMTATSSTANEDDLRIAAAKKSLEDEIHTQKMMTNGRQTTELVEWPIEMSPEATDDFIEVF